MDWLDDKDELYKKQIYLEFEAFQNYIEENDVDIVEFMKTYTGNDQYVEWLELTKYRELCKKNAKKEEKCPLCNKVGIVPVTDEDNTQWLYCFACYNKSKYKKRDQ